MCTYRPPGLSRIGLPAVKRGDKCTISHYRTSQRDIMAPCFDIIASFGVFWASIYTDKEGTMHGGASTPKWFHQ